MKSILLYCFLVFSVSTIYTQQLTVSGIIKEQVSGSPLSFANIRVAGTTLGTAANKDGQYELKLKPGKYFLIASFIGYISDTVAVNLNTADMEADFNLAQSNVELEEIVILPGENPALEIIRKAIARKKERNEKIISYEFEAYTKGIIRTEEDIKAGGNSVSLGIGTTDTSELKITGILENQSKGFYKKPDQYKETIIARKQSSNFPSSINVLTGGRLIQNFYSDDINFFGKDLPGPLADNALGYYYFYIVRTLPIDDKKVFQIKFTPDDENDPGFTGDVFITDSTFDMIKVDLNLNRAANTGGVFDTINIFQQFAEYQKNIYMPVDYRLFVTANIIGLIRFGFELNTILYDYKINPLIEDDFFDMALLTVLPEADRKDSVYWTASQTIPSTSEEQTAYQRIDSISNVPRTFWDDFSWLSSRMSFTENFSTTAPLGLYHFNRVEGHALDFGFYLDDYFDKRFSSSLDLTYGFSDKKFKQDFSASYLLGDYRTYSASLNVFNDIKILFGGSEDYNELTSTILSLASKYEFRDYYYSKGFKLNLSGEVFPVLKLNAGFLNRTDNNAVNNSDFSFFAKDRSYRQNPVINETKINALTAGFFLDFRKYIEDGLYRRRASFNKSYMTFDGGITYSDKSLLKSSLNFKTYSLGTFVNLNVFNSSVLNIRANGIYNDGTLPYQMLYSLPGNIDITSRNYSFRTLEVNEILGERVFTAFIEHNLRDELFRWMGIPGLKSWEIQLNTFLNIAYSDIKTPTESIQPHKANTFTHPFYEAGFGLGHVLLPIRVEFAWKLNHRGENNFRVGLSSFVF
ncbi:MAG: carboxypeptidase-like regulatory domain-containing protein [Ignavibacteriales bacterium]|nr:MAG: carboxypeptidase-like regulatory domain-containing protein [Ignavibacteriales bacterium]